nr:MAG: hypothetical protein [Penaeus semisulcatus pemonivirus]
MSWTIRRTLGAIALDKVVNISLVTLHRIACRKIEQETQGTLKRKRVIDNNDPEIDIVALDVRAVQNYFTDLPSTLINTLTEKLMKAYRKYDYYRADERILRPLFSMIIEVVFSPHLTSFHDEWMPFDQYDGTLEKYYNIEFYYNRLFKCSNLRELSLTRNPKGGTVRNTVIKTFQNFSHLTTLLLIPENSIKSFHWVISSVVRSCPRLKIFHIVYDGQRLEHQEDRVGIKDIVQCRDLVSLYLFDCSKFTSVNVEDDLQTLLKGLKYLKYIFHKQVISAIYDLNFRTAVKFGLERLDFFHEDKYSLFRVDHYKELVDGNKLIRLCVACPDIKVLRLAKPPCIFPVAGFLKNLQVLDLTECSDYIINDDLLPTIQFGMLKNLTTLKLTDVSCLDYAFFSDLARSCPDIEVISIRRSAIVANGQLIKERVSAFPSLKQLILKPHTPIDMWQVGIDLTYYFLSGAYNITHVNLEYDPSYMELEDDPTNVPRPNIFMSLKHLTFLKLITPPQILCVLVEEFLSHGSLHQISASCEGYIVALGREDPW